MLANTSIEQHDARLREMEMAWCREKTSPFPDHVRTTFATVRARLEARDAKYIKQANPTTTTAMAMDLNNAITTVEQQDNGEPRVKKEEGDKGGRNLEEEIMLKREENHGRQQKTEGAPSWFDWATDVDESFGPMPVLRRVS